MSKKAEKIIGGVIWCTFWFAVALAFLVRL